MKLAILFTIIIILFMLAIVFAVPTEGNSMAQADILMFKVFVEAYLFGGLMLVWLLLGNRKGQSNDS